MQDSTKKNGVHHVWKDSEYSPSDKLWINFPLFVFSNVSITKIYVTRSRQIKIITASTQLATLFFHLSVSANGNHS